MSEARGRFRGGRVLVYTSSMPKALQSPGPAEVGIRDLRAKLSAWLDQVRAGRELVITDRGRPVARVVPYDADVDDPLADLIARGLVRPPLRAKGAKLPAPVPTKGSVTDLLLQERREGW
jgi:prevent-host-death family protein